MHKVYQDLVPLFASNHQEKSIGLCIPALQCDLSILELDIRTWKGQCPRRFQNNDTVDARTWFQVKVSDHKYLFKILGKIRALIFLRWVHFFRNILGPLGDLFLGLGDLVHPNFGNRFGIWDFLLYPSKAFSFTLPLIHNLEYPDTTHSTVTVKIVTR